MAFWDKMMNDGQQQQPDDVDRQINELEQQIVMLKQKQMKRIV
jgi:hypothetical protein